jgi:glycosyltransferase involved in cell wall biosynthesis
MAKTGLIKIFTEVSADADNINAQSLSVRQIISRLDPGRFAVTMTHRGEIDPRLASRPNTRFIRAARHGTLIKNLLAAIGGSPDIFFYPLPSPVTEIFLWARRNLRLKTKLVVHAVSTYGLMRDFKLDWFGGTALPKSIVQADFVAANGSSVARDVEQQFGREAQVIYDVVDGEVFFPPSQREARSRIQVLYVGSFRPYKQTPQVIEAAAAFPELSFTLIGDGEERQSCESEVKRLSLQNVTFLGNRPPKQIGDAMRSSHIFFFPSVMEGHPQVLCQAAACGLPCVARDLYRPDAVIHGTTGFLASNEQQMREYLALLARDAGLRERFGYCGVEHAKCFGVNEIASQWAGVFESLAGGT